MESRPVINEEYIQPAVKRSIHIGCQNYSILKADSLNGNLTQCWNDAKKLQDFCDNSGFDHTQTLTDQKLKPWKFYDHIIQSFEDLIQFSKGPAQAKKPIYTFNFISFSCHGVMSENEQTLAVIPYQKDKDSEFEKKFININYYAQALAEIPNTINVILFDGCRNKVTNASQCVTEEEKGTNGGRSKENFHNAIVAKDGTTKKGFSLIIYSSSKGQYAIELKEKGGRGTLRFLKEIEENQQKGHFSWEFIDFYEELYIEKITLNKRIDWKKIIMFPNQNIPNAIVQKEQEVRPQAQAIVNYDAIVQQIQQEQIPYNNQIRSNQEEEKLAIINQNKLRFRVINNDGEAYKKHVHPLYLCDGDREEWVCQGEYEDQKCYGNVLLSDSPMIQSHACIIENFLDFRFCRSCFQVYCKGASLGSIIGIPRIQNKNLYFHQWNNKERHIEYLNTYYYEKKKWLPKKFENTEECIQYFWPKIIPLDSKYVFLIGGSSNLDFKTQSEQEPEHSIFLYDVPNCKIVERKRMLEYRHHCATALYKKKVDGEEKNIGIIIAGGEMNGEWMKSCIFYNLETQEQKFIQQLQVAVAGPSLIAIDDAKLGMVLYLAGVDVKTNQSIIQKYSESDKEWKIALTNYGHDFGFCSFSYCKSDSRLLLIGGIQIQQGLIYGDTTNQIRKIHCESGDSNDGQLKDKNGATKKDYFYDNQVVASFKNPATIYIVGKDHVYEVDTKTLIGFPVGKGISQYLKLDQIMP